MKKIVLSIFVASSLLISADIDSDKEQLKKDIAIAKADAKVAKEKVEELEAKLPPNEKFMTHTELGFIQTRGNTDTKVFNLELEIKKGWDKNSLMVSFDGQYAEDSGVESKNKYFVELEYNYSFTDRLALVYLAGYKRDKFTGFNYQAYTGLGLNYLLLETKSQSLDIEVDILYSVDDSADIDYDVNGETIDYPNAENKATHSMTAGEIDKYAAYRAKAVYNWTIFSNLDFSQELNYRASFEDSTRYFVYSKTAFTSKISDIFSAGLSYKVDYVNSPPSDKQYTDRTFTANLIIDY
ncbi:MAG: DUF481 domain-containing protein [Campylobacterota bacterium]|nr:DUF481 domain-containing protein [Campylobacterota bacterium]